VDGDKGLAICRRIQDAIAGKEMQFNDQSIPVTVSQCVVVWDHEAGMDALIASVEQALAATEPNGPNRLERVGA